MSLKTSFASSITVTALTVMATFSTPAPVQAADHADAPALAQDQGADISDVFLFRDPVDSTQTVLIATVHAFLVPGAINSFAEFDANIRYRFEIFNDHVNFVSPVLDNNASATSRANFIASVKPNRFIDVTFSKRQVGPGAQTGTGGGPIPKNLRRPLQQQATVTFTGFTGLKGTVFKTDTTGAPLLVTPFNVSFTTPAPAFLTPSIKVSATANVQFFAGEVDDPYYLDVPALTSFTDGIRNGTGPNVGAFNRARDTYAGYNTLAIAIKIPTALLLSDKGPFIGLDFLTQRHVNQVLTNNGVTGGGAFKTLDRMGNPIGILGLIPFDQRNAYNAGTAHQDTQGKFSSIITETLNNLGLVSNPAESAYTAMANILIAYGDLLQLDTTISNAGSPAGAGFDHKDSNGFALPNGRRLQDDTVDILLTTINHNMSISDSIANSGTGSAAVTSSFPFLGLPNQSLPSGSTDPTKN